MTSRVVSLGQDVCGSLELIGSPYNSVSRRVAAALCTIVGIASGFPHQSLVRLCLAAVVTNLVTSLDLLAQQRGTALHSSLAWLPCDSREPTKSGLVYIYNLIISSIFLYLVLSSYIARVVFQDKLYSPLVPYKKRKTQAQYSKSCSSEQKKQKHNWMWTVAAKKRLASQEWVVVYYYSKVALPTVFLLWWHMVLCCFICCKSVGEVFPTNSWKLTLLILY